MKRMAVVKMARGFTLIELLVVITLVGILVQISSGDWRAYLRRQDFNGASRAALYAVQSGRAEAARRGTQTRVKLGPGSIVAFVDNNRSGDVDAGDTRLYTYPTSWFSLRDDVTPVLSPQITFTSDDNIESPVLTFNSMGRPVDQDGEPREWLISASDARLAELIGAPQVHLIDVYISGSARIR